MLKNVAIGALGFALALIVVFTLLLIPRMKALNIAWNHYQVVEGMTFEESYELTQK